MAKLDDRSVRRDRFHKQAQKAGFRARAVFKLEEIDHKVHLLRPGQRVLDLGCAPGSWLQYARSRVGDAGALVGLDRAPLAQGLPGARLLVGDVHTISVAELLGPLPAFDVVLTDMAPDTCGIRHVDQARSEALFERALEIAEQVLAPAGGFCGKLFMGPDFKRLVDRCRGRFATVKTVKPESSRSISIEQYVVATGFSPGPVGSGAAAGGAAPR
jgi:23S rRNA (uridine2552-2'-O)-methyltransferase